MTSISLGARSTFGLYLKPVIADLGTGREMFSIAIAIQNPVWGLSQPFAGAIADKYGAPRVLSNSAATVTVSVTDISALTTSDYRLDYDGATYTLTRVSDSAVAYSGALFPPPAAVDGLSFTLAGAPAAGDSFLVQPTRAAARDFAATTLRPPRTRERSSATSSSSANR